MRSIRESRLILGAAIVAGMVGAAGAVDGVAVTNCWRYACYGWQSQVPEGADGEHCATNFNRGSILRFTIQNNQVVSRDTIVNMRTALCQFPVISLDGGKVAFFRWAGRVEGNGIAGLDGTNYISVVDIDGTNLRDLVALPCKPGIDNSLDWPSDGWIYYVKPISGSLDSRTGSEVWKVNPYASNPASTNQLVYSITSCQLLRRFSVSQPVNRVAEQSYPLPSQGDCGSVQRVRCFPPTSNSSCGYGMIGSCNARISASGDITGGYNGGSHNTIQLGKWNGSGYQAYDFSTFCTENASIWGAFTWSNFDMGSSAGCEQMNFACNSDKWVAQRVMWLYSQTNCGTNQLLTNWVDKQAVNVTKFPNNPPRAGQVWMDSGIALHAGVGDFWVKQPAGKDYAYETIDGVWHQMTKPPGFEPTVSARAMLAPNPLRLTTRVDAGGLMAIDMGERSGACLVTIRSVAGRAVATFDISGTTTVDLSSLPHGAYTVSARTDDISHTARILLPH